MQELVASALSPLVGRADELEHIEAALAGTRMLTLIGPAGCGKTRLAVATLQRTPGAAGIALAGVDDAALVPSVAASALGVRPGAAGPLTAITTQLGDTETVVLLDNCEHVADAVVELAGELLLRCPGLRLLTTSRRALGMPCEVVLPVPPMSCAADGDAIALFLDRAARAVPGFVPTDDEAARIAGLCKRLDGLPLAIELAAGRLRLLDLDTIERGIERHTARALRSSIDSSWDLLDGSQRAVFARLAVFADGWELDAAEAVCTTAVERDDVLDILRSLVDRSLVRVERRDRHSRFVLLQTLRAFATERLGDDAETARAAHAAWCCELAETTDPALAGSEQGRVLGRLDREIGNLRAALTWATEAEPETALRLAIAAAPYWYSRGLLLEGRRFLTALAPALAGAPVAVQARARWALGLMLVSLGELTEAEPVVADALELAQASQDPRLLARALSLRAELGMIGGVADAETSYEQAAALARDHGDAWCLADALAKQGAAAVYRGEATQAVAALEECRALAQASADDLTLYRALGGLARAAHLEGRDEQGAALLREALGVAERLGDRSWIAADLAMLGDLERAAGRLAEGRALVEQGHAIAEKIGAAYALYVATGLRGRAAQAVGDLDRAGEAFAAALALAARDGLRPYRSWWHAGLGEVALARQDLVAAREHFQDALSVAEAIPNRREGAVALAGLGTVALARGDTAVALDQLSRGLAIAHDVGDRTTTQRALEQVVTAMRAGGREALAERLLTAAARDEHGVDEAVALALRGRGSRAHARGQGWGGLTPAEAEVARLAAAGASNPEIADALFMSRSTVKTHLSHVYAKLGVANRTELAAATASTGTRKPAA